MATFSKDQVIQQGSLEGFAEWAECYKVYQLPNGHNFIAIRSGRDEDAMYASEYCRGAKLVYEKGTKIPFDWDSLLIKSQAFYGKTEEEAKAAVKAAGISADQIKEITLTHAVGLSTVGAQGADETQAITAAQKQIPSNAFEIGAAQIVEPLQTGVIELQAETEKDAREQCRFLTNSELTGLTKEQAAERRKGRMPYGASLDRLECVAAPRKGLLGIGKKAGVWKAYWSIPCRVQISYKTPAEVTVTYLDQTSIPKKSIITDLHGKTLVLELSLPKGKSRDATLQSLKQTALAQQQGMGHGSEIVLGSLLKEARSRKVLLVENVQSVIEAEDSILTLIAKLKSLNERDACAIYEVVNGKAWEPRKGDPFFDALCRQPADCYGRWSHHAKAERGVILRYTDYR